MLTANNTNRFRFWLWLVRGIGVLVPQRLRADWRQEWEAELQYRETLLAEWDKLDWQTKLDLLRRSLGAFQDALLLQPRRLEDEMFQDLRYGVRMLVKHPGFTLIAILTLALGIGANTAIFSVVNAVLLRPLPYQDTEHLAMLWTNNPRQGIHEEGTSYPTFLDWRAQSQFFTEMAICSRGNPVVLSGVDEPERVMGEYVSANLFPLLGVKPALGRAFTPDDEQRRERVVVLSYRLWQRRFGAAPDVVGRSLEINGQNRQVIGVMPMGFYFPAKETQLWEPVTSASYWERQVAQRFTDTWRVVGRLKPQVTLSQAQTEMTAIGQRLAQAYPNADEDFAGFGVNVVPLLDQITGKNLQLALWVLLGAVALVLLIACANVANLLLARGATREREFALRVALGAGRARLVRQLLTESLLLALSGGALGLLLARWGMALLVRFAPSGIPRLDEIKLDARVLAVALVASLLNGLLFGLLPAWKSAQPDPNEALKEGGRSQSFGSRRTRKLLVVAEFALAVVLLAGAGLLIRSFLRLQSVNPGFKPEGVLLARVSLSQSTARTADQTKASFQQIIERTAKLPGVQAVGAIEDFFMRRNPDSSTIVEGRPPMSKQSTGPLIKETVSPGFFQALSVPLLKGRFFAEQEGRAAQVVIINETLARRFFPGEDPLGQRLQANGTWQVIVGVVGDMHRQTLEKQPVSEIYLPGAGGHMDVVVRVQSDPLQFVAAVREAVRSVEQTATVHSVTTVEQRLEELGAERRFQTWLLSLFAALALGLAAIGIYGVMSYSVAERTREIGVRVALGAQMRDVLKLIVGQGMTLALMGVALGLAASFGLTRLMSGLLFGVSATDPLTFVGITLLLVTAALLACVIPACRATRVDPMVALRHE
jgi:putative ABC transport system permease protein